MIKKPETYNELKVVKNVLAITKYYNVSKEFLDEAYDFVMKDKKNYIQCMKTKIVFHYALNMNGCCQTISFP